MGKKTIVIEYDNKTALGGKPIDLYDYLRNEMDNAGIRAGICEITAKGRMIYVPASGNQPRSAKAGESERPRTDLSLREAGYTVRKGLKQASR